ASNAAVSIAILAAIAFLLWQQRASEITPVLIGCAIVLFVINLGRFTKFKYGSAELEAVTDARKATEEAYATIAQLRELSAKVAKVALALLPGDGRLGGLGDFARLELKQEVVETLTRIGLSAEQLRDAADVFDEFYASLHAFNVVRVFWISHEGSRDKETGLLFGYRDYNRLAKRFVNYSNRHRTPPRELRKQLAEIAPLSPPVEEALEDYEYFLKEKKFKRQADWE
ncbi:MAG: hypothetical protein L6Q76_08910, partial [Polyangiaceae bacterium]|nr:hypothetical protein [Polyangiaceae bacterium]